MIDEHPRVGSVLTSAPGLSPIVRILERIGQQICTLGVPDEQQWAAVGALMAYILGVSRQNAANGQLARTRGLDRSDFLEAVSTAWLQLDPEEYPFARSVAGKIRDHDDRVDFLAGIDLILRGIGSESSEAAVDQFSDRYEGQDVRSECMAQEGKPIAVWRQRDKARGPTESGQSHQGS